MDKLHPQWDRIDTVLVDMDGTLLDLHFDNHIWQQIVPVRYAREQNLPLEHITGPLQERLASRRGTLEWYCLDYWTAELGIDVPKLHHEHRERIRWLPGATAFLGGLRAMGKPVAVVTNAHLTTLRIKIARTGLDGYVDHVFSAHDVGWPKEDVRFWPLFRDRFSFDSARTLLVDDNPDVLHAARRFGIAWLYAVARPDSLRPPCAVRDFPAVDSVADLLGQAPVGRR